MPGVELHAYLSWGPAAAWGDRWLDSGTISSRYSLPTYDGSTVTIEFDEDTGECRLRNEKGEVTATATATLPDNPPTAPSIADYPEGPLPSGDLPEGSPESLAKGTVLGSISLAYPDDVASTYVDLVRETLPVYTERGVAHPGWIVRQANKILTSNVTLGPWIHVGSEVQNYAQIQPGSQVSTRGTVVDEYDKSGHRFVVLDVAVCSGDQVASTVRHTAIYLPRHVREAA